MLEAEGRSRNPSHTPGGGSTNPLPQSVSRPPSPASHTQKDDPTLLSTRSGADGVIYSLRWLVAPSDKGPDVLLYLAQRDPSHSRSYCADVPCANKEEFVSQWKAAFEEKAPETFEGLFLQKASATLLNNSLDADAPEQVEPRKIEGTSFFTPLGVPIESHTNSNGVVIRVYQDKERLDYVVTVSGSASPRSDCLAFRMKESEHWRTHEPIRPLLQSLAVDSHAEREKAINELMGRTAKGEVFLFNGSEPRSLTVAAAIRRLASRMGSTVAIKELKHPDHFGIAAALANESVTKISRLAISEDAQSAITDLLLTYSDEGLGSFALTVGWRDNTSFLGAGSMVAIGAPARVNVVPTPQITRPPTSIAYDFDLRDLTSTEQITWFESLITNFTHQRSGLHGPLTQLIADQLLAETFAGAPRMYESQRHPELRSFIPDQKAALEQQIKKISIYFRPENTHVIARTLEGTVVEVKNTKGDRLHFTVRPEGIEEVFLFPRETRRAQKQAIGYHLKGVYQLNNAQGELFASLFRHFTAENGTLHRISDREGRSVGAIGAWITHHFLAHYAPRHHQDSNSPCFAVVEPPSADDRCNQAQSVVAFVLQERYRGHVA